MSTSKNKIDIILEGEIIRSQRQVQNQPMKKQKTFLVEFKIKMKIRCTYYVQMNLKICRSDRSPTALGEVIFIPLFDQNMLEMCECQQFAGTYK